MNALLPHTHAMISSQFSRRRPLLTVVLTSLGLVLSSGACAPKPLAPTPGPATPASAPSPSVDARYAELPAPLPRPEFNAPTATRTQLNNGLSVWHMKQADTPLVSIHLMLKTGSSSDPKGKEGLSVLAADLLDEGAGKLTALELSDALGELATDYSSSAGVDYVLLSMSALAENLEPSLALLADIVQKPRLERAEFERRREHHVATALSSRDDPRDARGRALATALFGAGYAGRPPSGTVDSLKSITHLDVKAHAKALTVPEGAHVILAGGVQQSVGHALVERYFAGWSGKTKAQEPRLHDEPEGRVAYVIDFPGATQSSLAVARRAGADGDPNYFAEEIMNDRLGGSFTSRINMNLREDKGYTYVAQSVFKRYHYAGYWGIFSDVISEATAASVKEIFGELGGVCTNRPFSDGERNEAVEGMLLGFVMDFAETESVGLRLASLPLRDRPVDFWSTWPEQVAAVTTARANEVAQPYCDLAQFSVVAAGDAQILTPQLQALGLRIVAMDRDGHLVSP